MKTAALYHNLEFKEDKPAISVLLETSFTKEIRIAFKSGQLMQKHQTPFPIIVELVSGELDFGVNDEVLNLKKGDLIALDGGTPHDLKAVTECIVRLTLSKSDDTARVKNIVQK